MHFGGEPAGMGSERVPSPRVRKGTTGTTYDNPLSDPAPEREMLRSSLPWRSLQLAQAGCAVTCAGGPTTTPMWTERRGFVVQQSYGCFQGAFKDAFLRACVASARARESQARTPA
jgi:hypothetical protein